MKILWFAIDCNVYTHPKTMRLAETLKLDVDTVVGKLGRLWGWAKLSGNETGEIGFLPDQEIADIMRWKKKPSVLTGALVDCGFLDRTDNGKSIHGWTELNGRMTEQKRKDNDRKRGGKSVEIPRKNSGKSEEVPGKIHAYSTVQNSTVQPTSSDEEVGDVGADAHLSASSAEKFQEIYNSVCTNLPRCKVLTDKRKRDIWAFCKQIQADEWEKVCQIANESPFCTGQNDRGWKADFDFLIRPDKATNILEGRYDDKQGEAKTPNSTVQDPAQVDRLHQELDWMDVFLQEREQDG